MLCPRTIFLWFFTGWLLATQGLAQNDFSRLYDTDTLQILLENAKLEKDTQTIGHIAARLGAVYMWERKIKDTESLDLITLSVESFLATGDSLKYYRSRGTLVGFYMETNRWDEAEKILLGNIAFNERSKDSSGLVHNMYTLARLYEEKGETEKAQFFAAKALEINKTVKDTLIEIIALYSQSDHFKAQGNFDESMRAARRGTQLSKVFGRTDFQALNLFQIGTIHQFKEQLDSAIFYLKLAEKIGQEHPYSKLRKRCYFHLATCYSLQNDFEKAYHYSNRYAALLDSISIKKRADDLDQLVIAYETKENQLAIKQLENDKIESDLKSRQKNHFLLLLTSSLLMLFVFLGLVIRFYKDRIKKDKIITQQAQKLGEQKINTLKDELQITAIQSMLRGQEKERTRIALDLHDSIGGMLSMLKFRIADKDVQTHQLLNDVTEEVRAISQNIQPSALEELGFIAAISDLVDLHQLQKASPFIIFQHFNIPDDLDQNITLHFYRFIQEALQNAMKHSGAQEILIELNGSDEGISILVEDDGKGFDLAETTKGEGLKNLQLRAEFLKANYTLESNADGTTLFLLWKKEV